MKRIKLAAKITILCMVFTMIASKSYAVDESFELQLEASSTTLHPGDSFSVNIMIDNMNVTSGDQGIGAYQTKIIYDTNVLELVNVTPATGWEVLENEGNMVANTSNAEVVKERTHTATINFKVLDDVTLGDTTISLESIQGSSGTTTINGTGISQVVSIVEKDIDDNNPPDDNTTGDDNIVGGDNTTGDDNTVWGDNTTGDDNTVWGDNTTGDENTAGDKNNAGGSNTNKNQIGTSSNKNQSTTSNKVLPYAGIRNAIIIAIGVVIVAAVVFYIKYRRAV